MDKIRVLNIMESLGVGGGQVMMFELSNGLNKYFGDKCTSIVAGAKPEASAIVSQPILLETYGIPQLKLSYKDLVDYCVKESIDIVVHHRVSISSPVKTFLPKNVKYVVISHTAAALDKIRHFYACADSIVSVCKNIFICSPKRNSIDSKKMPVILNGIENDFVEKIEPKKLRGIFKTGRCHRLVPTKFKLDSLGFFEAMRSKIPGHVHYVMGSGNKGLPAGTKGKIASEYIGEVTDRYEKYAYIKAFDVYFYEIFANEGASIAVLESLAAGVPVVCMKRGGIKELIRPGVNGFIEKDRKGMFNRLIELHKKPEELKKIKLSTAEDFKNRLHIKICAKQYIDLFENLMRK